MVSDGNRIKGDLGLDISTSCTGVSVISPDGSLLDLTYISLKGSKTLWGKSDITWTALEDLCKAYDIQRVFVEENLQKFRPGLSSAKTISTLAKFNGIVSYQAYRIFGVEPIDVNVNNARKTLGIKLDRKDKSRSTKEKVLDQVDTLISEEMSRIQIYWPAKILSSGPRKGQTVLLDACGDMADAWVICKAGQHISS